MRKKVIIISFVLLVIDIVSKLLVDNLLSLGERINVIPNFFDITLVYNKGASFSILSGHILLFILASILVLIYLFKNMNKVYDYKLNIVILSMFISGTVGNMIDRIVYGHVVDFISLYYNSYYFAIFNIADMFITISVILFIIVYIKKRWSYDNNI